MLTARENFLETIRGGKPDRFVKQFEGLSLVRGDPVNKYVRGTPYAGMEPMYDAWGTRMIWRAGDPGATTDPSYQALDDVTSWKDIIKTPDVIGKCYSKELWEPYLEAAAKIDRNENLLMMTAPVGVFERLHFLMGFEDTLCNFMLEPEAMEELAMEIGRHRLDCFRMMVEYVHPDVIIPHDDWGSKESFFVQPELWREIVKPACKLGYDYLHENGVIILHHGDSFMEPVVEDMIDLHIDVWQGVLPQNDIPRLQKQINGRMALMGGIDSSVVDRADSTEEEIRAEVRRVCDSYARNGYFIPSITYGGPGAIYPHVDAIINSEIDRCSAEWFAKK